MSTQSIAQRNVAEECPSLYLLNLGVFTSSLDLRRASRVSTQNRHVHYAFILSRTPMSGTSKKAYPYKPGAMEQVDDRKYSLLAIKSGYPSKSLVTRLVDAQRFTIDQEKSISFVENLECLTYDQSRPYERRSTDFRRKTINGFRQKRFVALSYTWDPSIPYENKTPSGKYRVAQAPWEVSDQSSKRPLQSPVRDRVFDRVTSYMRYQNVQDLWIDQHCIEQAPGPQKQIGMQAMDKVYSVSEHPIALLARPVRRADELELLIQILSGELVREDQRTGDFRLCCRPSTASRAFRLLKGITKDLWWTRGWTFQENYRALPTMTLLMPHCSSLERQKRQAEPRIDLGDLGGELCIKSWIFHQEATKFCLAFEKTESASEDQCQEVIRRAPKYTILLQQRDKHGHRSTPASMSPRIISDVSARGLKTIWDRLAIISNCCQYTVRLDSTSLSSYEPSISLSILGLYLMNGELLSNHPKDAIHAETAGRLNVEEFIALQSYKGYSSSLSDPSFLTFNKGCRLFQAVITQMGMQAKGYVWRIQRTLPAEWFFGTLPWEAPSTNGLDLTTRRRLKQLADVLKLRDENFLAQELIQFLSREAKASSTGTFAMRWMRDMAECLVAAIDNKQALFIAQLIRGTERQLSSGAIFIADVAGNPSPRFVFTSFWPERPREDVDNNDLDRHISLVVDFQGNSPNTPRLFTKEWIHGLCFYKYCSPREVVFPWPKSIMYL